jgi:hypothetical protein
MPAGPVPTVASTRAVGFFIDNCGKIIKFPTNLIARSVLNRDRAYAPESNQEEKAHD